MTGAETGKPERTKPSIRALLWETAILQVLLAVLGGLAADFGVLATWVMNAIATYWVVVLPMLIFRRSCLTKFDIWFLRWGFLILLGIYLTFGATIHEWVQQLR